MYKITRTIILAIERRRCYGCNTEELCLKRGIAAAQCSKPPGQWRQGRPFCRVRILRCPRYGAGQIRNAAARAQSWMVCITVGKNFWIFPERILSSENGFSTSRYLWIVSPSTGAAASTQILRRSDGFYQKCVRGKRIIVYCGSSPAGQKLGGRKWHW